MIAFDSAITDKLNTRFRTHPCWIFSWDLNVDLYSASAAKLSGVPLYNRIVSIGNLSKVASADGSAAVGEIELTFDDTDGTMREVLKKTNLHLRKASLHFTFLDESGNIIMNAANSSQIYPAVFAGVLKVPSFWAEDSRTITLSIVSVLSQENKIKKPTTVTFGSNESITDQDEWPACIGDGLWAAKIALERSQIYVTNVDASAAILPVTIPSTPNVVGAPDGVRGVRCIGKLPDGRDKLVVFVFDKNSPSTGPRLTSGSDICDISTGTKLYLSNIGTSYKSWWTKWILNRYTGQYFTAAIGNGPGFNHSLAFDNSTKIEQISITASELGLTALTTEGYKIGSADLSGNTNQYAGIRLNYDPIIWESFGYQVNFRKFLHVEISVINSGLRFRQVLREFLEVFGGLTCGTSLTSSLYDSAYPANQTAYTGICTETGQDVIKNAEQVCKELGFVLFENTLGQIEFRPLKYSTADYTLTYSTIKLGSIKISESSEAEVITTFKLNSIFGQLYNLSDNPDGAASVLPSDISYEYTNNTSLFGKREVVINSKTASYIRQININGLKHYGYLKSNRWLQLEVTVVKVGLQLQLFDVIQVSLPNEIPMASGVCRGRLISNSTNPETLESTLKIELAIKAGSANSGGLYTEDAAYWNGPA
jgi:hypothetical protein